MAKVVLEPVAVSVDAPSPYETYTNGLDAARMLDELNLELKGIKTSHAKEWKRKYGKFNKKTEA